MTIEAGVTKGAKDTIKTGVKMVDAGFKKAWSLLDAATEKQKPSEVLSQKAVSAIQGKRQGQEAFMPEISSEVGPTKISRIEVKNIQCTQ